MIAKSYIEKSLIELNNLYNNSSSQKKAIYYSKLSIIELCGWIEEICDDIILRHSNRCLKLNDNKRYIKQIIKRNNGFDYDNNIRPMLIKLIGIIKLEEVEKKLEKKGGQITILKSTLETLKIERNKAAHTYLKGSTRLFSSPSISLNHFHILIKIFKLIENELKKH